MPLERDREPYVLNQIKADKVPPKTLGSTK